LKDLQETLKKVAKKTHTCYTLVFQIVRPVTRPVISVRDVENVKITKVKIVKLTKRVETVRETIRKLIIKKDSAPEEEKPVIEKKIVTLRKVEVKIVKTIKKFERVVDVIENPRPVEPVDQLPKPLTPSETKIVKVFEKTIKVNVTKISVIRKKLVTLEKTLESTPVEQRPEIVKKITIIRKTIERIVRETNIIRRNVISIKFPEPVFPAPAPVERPITPEDKKIVTEFKKTVVVHKRTVKVLRRKLVVLRRRFVQAPVSERPTIKREITVIRKKIVKEITKIVNVQRTINRIVFVQPVRPSPLPVVVPGTDIVLPAPKPTPTPVPVWAAKETTTFVKTCNGKRTAYEQCVKEWKQISKKCDVGSLEEGVLEGCIKKKKECDGSRKESKRCFHEIGQITRPVRPTDPTEIPFGTIVKPLSPVVTKIVDTFVKKIEVFQKKVDVVVKKIEVLEKERETAPVEKIPEITKKIVVLRKIVEKIEKKIIFSKQTIVRVKLPVRLPEEPIVTRPVVNEETKKIVNEFKKTVTVFVSKKNVVV
jgi:hypothetical protein